MIPNVSPRRTVLAPLFTLLGVGCALSLLWNMPSYLTDFDWLRLAFVSIEIVVVFAVLALVAPLRDGRLGVAGAVLFAVATTVVVVLKAAELTVIEVLDRPFNPLLDVRLTTSVMHLLTGTLGGPIGWAAVAGLALAPLVVCAVSYLAVRRVQRLLNDRVARRATLAICLALVALFAIPQASGAGGGVVSNDASLALLRYTRAAREAARGIEQMAAEIADDPWRGVPAKRMLHGLRGADVLLLFVESYGRSAVEMPRYAERTAPILAAFEERLAAGGLSSASAWLTSPTAGGQSWLPTATLTSGLWLADQGRYDVAMQTARVTLVRAFARAGYRTVTLKPAVVRPWPEGARLGFEQVYAAADLGYAGKMYKWVTMPDQYTLSVLERAERRGNGRPLYAEVSLISSHWPWTPIPAVMEDWSDIGDGRVFSARAEEDDPPEEVWSEPERERTQYGHAIGYVLRVLSSYAANFVDERTLLIVVGDHQPPLFITGEDAGRDVPIHVFSGDARLLAPFETWGFTRGMRPSRDVRPRRMDEFRDFFLEAFSTAAAGAAPSQ
jgi:hypothetical protein